MNASHFSVPVLIGGETRTLICDLRALDEIQRETGRNPLDGSLFGGASARDYAAIIAALLRRRWADVTTDDVLGLVQPHELGRVLEAVSKAVAGPETVGATTAGNPLPANA